MEQFAGTFNGRDALASLHRGHGGLVASVLDDVLAAAPPLGRRPSLPLDMGAQHQRLLTAQQTNAATLMLNRAIALYNREWQAPTVQSPPFDPPAFDPTPLASPI